ncbi:cyclic-phosphate processing receiver domain-containing protein [Escherichia coli]
MTFHILIDDVRNLNGMDIIIRTPEAAVEFLNNTDTTGHVVYFDNDLAVDGMEGYQILRLLLEFGQRPKKVVLVTSNPVAKQTMRNDLLDLGYKENPNRIEYDWQE